MRGDRLSRCLACGRRRSPTGNFTTLTVLVSPLTALPPLIDVNIKSTVHQQLLVVSVSHTHLPHWNLTPLSPLCWPCKHAAACLHNTAIWSWAAHAASAHRSSCSIRWLVWRQHQNGPFVGKHKAADSKANPTVRFIIKKKQLQQSSFILQSEYGENSSYNCAGPFPCVSSQVPVCALATQSKHGSHVKLSNDTTMRPISCSPTFKGEKKSGHFQVFWVTVVLGSQKARGSHRTDPQDIS